MPKVLAAIGRSSARHRLIIVAAWLVLFAGLTAVTAAGMDTSATGSAGNTTAAAKALTVVNEKFDLGSSSSGDAKTLQLVLQARDGAKVTDQATAAEVQAVLADAKGLPHVQTVSDPFAQRNPMVSKDGTTVISTLTFSGVTEANQEKTYDTVPSWTSQPTTVLRSTPRSAGTCSVTPTPPSVPARSSGSWSRSWCCS